MEVPNKLHRMVHLGDIFRRDLGEKSGTPSGSPLSVWLGKDIAGNSVWTDLAKMPHLLVAGTTGSGKSGCVNTMLSSSCCAPPRTRSAWCWWTRSASS